MAEAKVTDKLLEFCVNEVSLSVQSGAHTHTCCSVGMTRLLGNDRSSLWQAGDARSKNQITDGLIDLQRCQALTSLQQVARGVQNVTKHDMLAQCVFTEESTPLSVVWSIFVVPQGVFRRASVRHVVCLPEEAVTEEGQQLLNSHHLQGAGQDWSEQGHTCMPTSRRQPLQKSPPTPL